MRAQRVGEACDQALELDRVRVTATRARRAHVVMFPLAAILIAFYWGAINPPQLIAPLVVLVALALRGMWLGQAFTAAESDGTLVSRVDYFSRRLQIGVVLYGAAAGLIGVALFVPGDTALQLPVMFVIALVAAGGLTTQVAYPRAMHWYHALSLGPLIVRLAIDGTASSLAIASSLVVFGVALTIVGRGGAQAFRELAHLKQEKSRIADELRVASTELEASNKVLDDRVRAVTERLAQANQLAGLGRLAAGLGHEINNPLAWIIANREFLAEGVEQAVMSRELKRDFLDALVDMEKGTDRIQRIVFDMSSLARDSADDRVDLHVLIRRCVRVVQKANTDREIEHELIGPSAIVIGSATRLSQLMLNVLMNATDAAAGEIVVRCTTEGEDVTVEVRDNGHGIDVEPIEQIFEPFYTTKRAGEGSGLGLAICRNIASEHNGSMSAVSASGETTISIRLPAAPIEGEPTVADVSAESA